MPHTVRPASASARSTVLRALAAAVSLLLALLGVAAVPATASAAELDAITGVEITRPTGEIHQGDSIRLDATWAVPDDARPGDTFRLALPTTPRVVGTADSFDLTDPTGAVVGTCAVDEIQVLCTLGEYAATHTEVAGTLFFWVKVTETSTSEVLVFRTGGGVEIRVDVPGGIREGKPWGWGAPTSPVKNGWFDTKDGRAHWQVNVPGQYLTGPDGEPVVVTDTFDPRLTLVTESIRMVAVPVTRWNGGNFWNEWFWLNRSQYVVETGPAANQFRFSVPDALGADHVYVLVYATEVPADARDGDRYGNSVTGLGTSTVTAAVRYAGGAGTGHGEALRSIRLAKQVDGGAAQDATGPFAFALDCRGTDGATLDGFPRSATVLVGGTTTFANVPVGAVCELSETDDGGADRVAFAPAGPIVVTTSSPAVIDVVATNTFDARVGGIAVTKRVTGSGADRVPAGTEFAVDYLYEGDEGQVSGELVLTDGSTAEIVDLPVGTVVTLSEARPGAVDEITWQVPAFTGDDVEVLPDGAARVVVPDGTTHVELMNEAVAPATPGEEPAVPSEEPTPPGEVPSSPEEVPSSPEEVPSSPEEVPSSPEEVPSSPEEVPSSPEEVPSSPEEVPSSPEEVPSSPEEVPSSPEEVPSSPEEVPSSPEEVPSSPGEMPSPEEVPSPPSPSSTATPDGGLALSGATVQAASVGAVVLLLAGILAVVARRRSRG